MLQQSNFDLEEENPYVHVSTLAPMRTKDVLNKNSCFFGMDKEQRFLIKTHTDI